MENKKPDRLNISKYSRKVMDKIDKQHFFNLDKESTMRFKLFMFAFALGVETDINVSGKNETSGIEGLVQHSAIKNDEMLPLLYAHHLYKNQNDNDIDYCMDMKNTYTSAQEYSDIGFKIIEGYMENKKDSDLLWELINELDQQYEELMSKYKKTSEE